MAPASEKERNEGSFRSTGRKRYTANGNQCADGGRARRGRRPAALARAPSRPRRSVRAQRRPRHIPHTTERPTRPGGRARRFSFLTRSFRRKRVIPNTVQHGIRLSSSFVRVCCLLMLCDGVRMYNQPCSETLHGLAPVRLLHEDLDRHWTMTMCAQHDGLPGKLAFGARTPAKRRVRPRRYTRTSVRRATSAPVKCCCCCGLRPGGAVRRGQTRAADRRAGRPRGGRPRGGSPRDRPAADHRAAGGRSGRAAGGAARGAWPPPS